MAVHNFSKKKMSTIRLYRHILRKAIIFPSKKRDNIVKEIRIEFRNNKHLPEGEILTLSLEKAKKG